MADVSPFDESPARRPTVADLGGAAKIDGPVKPDPVTMLTAHDLNEFGLVGAGVAGVCPLAIVVVTQAAGVYSVTSVRAPGSGVVVGSFTPTKNGTGDVTLTCQKADEALSAAVVTAVRSGANVPTPERIP